YPGPLESDKLAVLHAPNQHLNRYGLFQDLPGISADDFPLVQYGSRGTVHPDQSGIVSPAGNCADGFQKVAGTYYGRRSFSRRTKLEQAADCGYLHAGGQGPDSEPGGNPVPA